MPPKKIEKKEVKPIFDDATAKLWWEYRQFSEEEVQKINEFMAAYAVELKDSFKPTIKETLEALSKQMGISLNPVFKQYQSMLATGVYSTQDGILAETQPQLNIDLLKQVQPQPLQQPADKNANKQPPQQQQPQPSQQQQQAIQNQGQDPNSPQAQASNKLNYLLLENTKLDYPSLLLILYCFDNMPDYEILKISNNKFDDREVQYLIDWASNPANKKLQRIFWDWNPVSQQICQNSLPKLGLSNLQQLIIRSSLVDDVFVTNLCEKIQGNPNANIQHLELYDNRIGQPGIDSIGSLISVYQKLEYLSLAKNGIDDLEIVKPILNNIGYSVLSAQELEEYKTKEKQREDLIADAKKKKKKINEDDLPKQPPLTEVQPGQFAQVRNSQLKILNLSINPFGKKESEIELVNQFLSKLPDDFSLTLVCCNFESKQSEKLKQKYKKKVIL